MAYAQLFVILENSKDPKKSDKNNKVKLILKLELCDYFISFLFAQHRFTEIYHTGFKFDSWPTIDFPLMITKSLTQKIVSKDPELIEK